MRAVAEAIYESASSLALLPSGTSNVLARNVDLALDDLKDSIHTAFTGQDRQIDLADGDRKNKRSERLADLVRDDFGVVHGEGDRTGENHRDQHCDKHIHVLT